MSFSEIRSLTKQQSSELVQNWGNTAPAVDAFVALINSLSVNSLSNLERTISQKLETLSAEQLAPLLEAAVRSGVESGNKEVLATCQRIVSLAVLKKLFPCDPVEVARNKAHYLPKPINFSQAAKATMQKQLQQGRGLIGKIVENIVLTLSNAYSIDLNKPPKNEYSAQQRIYFFRNLIHDATPLAITGFALFKAWFTHNWKTRAVAVGAVLGGVCVPWIYKRMMPKKTVIHSCENLNEKARRGGISKTMGAEKAIQQIETCYGSPLPFGGSKHPLLIGPPGVGKTNGIDNLALKIEEREVPEGILGYTVQFVNAINLSQEQHTGDGFQTTLECILTEAEGKPVIIAIDEFYNALKGASIFGGGAPADKLKTALQKSNIKIIAAMTEDEYQEMVRKDPALRQRFRVIPIEEPSLEVMKAILRGRVNFVKQFFMNLYVSNQTLEAILAFSNSYDYPFHTDKHPRKGLDILMNAINYLYAWKPKKLAEEIQKCQKTIDEFAEKCREEEAVNRRKALGEFPNLNAQKAAEEELKVLKAKKAEQDKDYKKILELREKLGSYQQRRNELVHNIQGHEQEYLFTDFIVLEVLSKIYQEKIATFQQKYEEQIPTEVTIELVRELDGSRAEG